MDLEIKTPETHPDHETVGRDFMANNWHAKEGEAGSARYYCDSYDPRIGFWMTRVDAPPEHWNDQEGEWRHNVSERAIGRTYHVIYQDPWGETVSQWGGKPSVERPPGAIGEAAYLARRERLYPPKAG